MEMSGADALELTGPASVVELRVDSQQLAMDGARAAVQLVDESGQDWSHISQTPMQVVRVLSADGEVLQVLSSDYHGMDGHPVTIVPDDAGGHYTLQRDPLDVEPLSAPASETSRSCHDTTLDERTPPADDAAPGAQAEEPSLTLQLDIPFLTAENQHDAEVQFFADIYRYLVAGVTANVPHTEIKSLKRKLKEYSVVDGELLYGSRHPRQVVLDKEKQRHIIEQLHVDPKTGIHLGVKRMYSAIKFYWRNLYSDLTQHVRECGACHEEARLSRPPGLQITSLPRQRAAQHRLERSRVKEERHDADLRAGGAEDEALTATVSKAQVIADRAMRVWKKVEARVYGPYPETAAGHQYLLGLVDPASRWIEALPVPATRHPRRLADFIFSTFCTLGFAQCALVGVTEAEFEEMQDRYKERFEQMQQIFEKLEQPNAEQSFVFTLQGASLECSWATEMIDSFVEGHPDAWDSQLEAFLFGYHATVRADYGFSPFYVMYGRNSNGTISDEDKENCHLLEEEKALDQPSRPRRRLQSSVLQCRHCDEIFTSKISFRIHQRRHTEEAKRLGVRDGEEPLRPVALEKKLLRRAVRRKQGRCGAAGAQSRPSLRQPRPGWNAETMELGSAQERQAVTSMTVSAVKQLIEATREERSRRGKYLKYTEDMKDEIAEYALKHGHAEAARHYSQQLGGTISQSTIRNFIKAYKIFSPEMKEEIGRFGLEFGAEEATIHFSAKINRDLRVGIVKRYMKLVRDKMMKKSDESGASSQLVIAKAEQGDDGQCRRLKHTFTEQLKLEIGRHSLQYGISETIAHYSEKLQFAMKESTVRKFRKLAMDAAANKTEPDQHQQASSLPSAAVTTHPQPFAAEQPPLEPLQQLPPPVGVLGQPVSVASAGYVYNTYTIPASPAAGGAAFYQQSAGPLPSSSTIIVNSYSTAAQSGYQTAALCAAGAQPAGSAAAYLGNAAVLPVIQPAPPVSVQQQLYPAVLEQLDIRHQEVFSAAPARQTDPLQLATSEANISAAYGTVASVASQAPVMPVQETSRAPAATQQTAAQTSPPGSEQQPDEPPASASSLAGADFRATGAVLMSSARSGGCLPDSEDEDDPSDDDADADDVCEPPKPRKRKLSAGALVGREKKRGFYASYSPEIRAEIGKFAYSHGNLAAMEHFRERLGCQLPESTIRGLKEKYIVKLRKTDSSGEVTALGFAQRGRPIRLGKYDRLVQDCIRELVGQGEKVSTFLCIATAKQVLMQYEPNLLDERGGPIKLNITWAKSFLKRLGLNQNNS